MGLYDNHKYPWLNTHGLNLDWVINTVKELLEKDNNLDERFNEKLDKDGDLIGTWFSETYAQMLQRFVTKENSIDITNGRKLSPDGNFTGTLDGTSIVELFALINSNNAVTQQLIDYLNANPQLNITIEMYGLYGDPTTETETYGEYGDPVTEYESYGSYPVCCAI